MADAAGLRRAMERRVVSVASATRDGLVANLKEAAPYATGATRDDVHGTVRSAGPARAVITLTDDQPQAGWTDKGTRPHVIRPQSKRALAFRSGGVRVVVRSVSHPGTRATRWWRNQTTAQAVRQVVRQALGR